MRVVAIIALVLLALPVQAQTSNSQYGCRSVYLLGEKVPPGCAAPRNGGLPEYRRWEEGSGTTSTAPSAETRPPANYGLYHFGGHNALYGFGR